MCVHELSTCLRLRPPSAGGHGHSPSDSAVAPGIQRGSLPQASPEQHPGAIEDGSLLAQVLEVFADHDVVIKSVTPADEPSPLERKYFGGHPMYLRRDLEVVWRNAYRRALRLGLKPWQAERVAWRRVKKRSQRTKRHTRSLPVDRVAEKNLTGKENRYGSKRRKAKRHCEAIETAVVWTCRRGQDHGGDPVAQAVCHRL